MVLVVLRWSCGGPEVAKVTRRYVCACLSEVENGLVVVWNGPKSSNAMPVHVLVRSRVVLWWSCGGLEWAKVTKRYACAGLNDIENGFVVVLNGPKSPNAMPVQV